MIARGATLRVAAAREDGVITLEASGSPGAVLPVLSRIEAQLRAAVPVSPPSGWPRHLRALPVPKISSAQVGVAIRVSAEAVEAGCSPEVRSLRHDDRLCYCDLSTSV